MRDHLIKLTVICSMLVMWPLRESCAQDTLSDAAWNAQRAQRAALRQNRQAQLDSAAKLIDSIVAIPTVLRLRLGDSVSSAELFRQVTTIGITRRGDTVSAFTKTYALPINPVVELSSGMVYARSMGSAYLMLRAGRHLSPEDTVGPLTRIQIEVR